MDLRVDDPFRVSPAERVGDIQPVGYAEKGALPVPVLRAAVVANGVDQAILDDEAIAGDPRQTCIQDRLHPLAIEKHLDGLQLPGAVGDRSHGRAPSWSQHHGVPSGPRMRDASSIRSSTLSSLSCCNRVMHRDARSLTSATAVNQLTTAFDIVQGTLPA